MKRQPTPIIQPRHWLCLFCFLSLLTLFGCSGYGPVPCNGTTACPTDTVCDATRSLCVCKENDLKSCYTGPPATKGVGICKAGLQRCQNSKWAACLNETLPTKEDCSDNLDNDCDGVVNNGCKHVNIISPSRPFPVNFGVW